MTRQDEVIFQLIDKAKTHDGEIDSIEFDNELILTDENSVIYKAYSVDIGYRELSFNCENAILNYAIDTIGFNDYMILTEIFE